MFPHYSIGTKMKKYSCGPRMASRSRLGKTMAIIAAAGFLSFSAGLRAECTLPLPANGLVLKQLIVPSPRLSVGSDIPIGGTVQVVSKVAPATGRYWTCESSNDTVVLRGSDSPNILGNSGLAMSTRVKVGDAWRQAGDVLFRGPGTYQTPAQTHEFTFTKESKIIPQWLPMERSPLVITSGDAALSQREYDVLILSFSVLVAPCTVGPTSQTVTLAAKERDLNAIGFGPYSHFNFQLSNCPAGISEVKATMTGMLHGSDPTVFANGGTAQGIGIQISNSTTGGIIVPNVNGATRWVTDAPAAKNYAFRARVKKTGNVKAGTISAVTQIRFDYN